MKAFITWVDKTNDFIGMGASLFNHLLVWLICVDVLMRYFFSASEIWIMEVEIYFYAFIFLLGAGFAFRHDRHVRVDVFYAKMSERSQALIDVLGGILFLLPWTAVVIAVSYQYAAMSFRIGEGSSQPGGLPWLWILKSLICIGFLLLFVQGLANIFRAVLFLQGKTSFYKKRVDAPKTEV